MLRMMCGFYGSVCSLLFGLRIEGGLDAWKKASGPLAR